MNYHSTTTTSGGMDGTDLAAIALVLWAVGGRGGGGGGLQGGGRDICRIVVVVKGEEEEEEEGRQQWEGADDHAVIVPPLRNPAARGSEHVLPPRLPPGNRTGHPVLQDKRQHDGEDHRRTLATIIAVGLEDGRGCARDRVIFWVRCVPALVPRVHHHRT